MYPNKYYAVVIEKDNNTNNRNNKRVRYIFTNLITKIYNKMSI